MCNAEFGAGFLVASTVFFVLGITMLFNRACLAMANVLLLCGITLLMGPRRTVSFFAARFFQGTAFLLCGIAIIIFVRWAAVGFAVELFGLVRLFAGYSGIVAGFVSAVPVVGPYLAAPLRRITGFAPRPSFPSESSGVVRHLIEWLLGI